MNELIDITSKILSGRQAFLTNLQPDQEKALQAILKSERLPVEHEQRH